LGKGAGGAEVGILDFGKAARRSGNTHSRF